MIKLYLCIGCFKIHYDNDYSEEDGDIEIIGKFRDKYLKLLERGELEI